tara:strand:+ start:1541 stop:1825 length:285 start_codon:yes stop_codon:yes gene_type:complete
MSTIFTTTDKTGRTIRLTKERWNEHIRPEHPDIHDHDEIKQTLLNPDTIIQRSEKKLNYYKFFKHNKLKYLKVIVKLLNGEGFVLTAYFVSNIK